MYYADIKKADVANGLGVRVSVFVSGCTHHCKNCFNEEAWDFHYGNEFTQNEIDKVIELMDHSYVAGLSLLGGEPLEHVNQQGLLPLVKVVKEKFPDKNIWCYSGYTFEKDIKDRIKYLNKTFDMESFLYQRIGTLSTGQTQRVSIARCLMHDPKYYILDEPTSGLDIISSKVILDTIKEEKDKGKCILYSTHYMEEAESICDRVVLMNNGKIITIGTPEEIRKKTNTSNLREAFFALTGGDNDE